MTRTSPGARSWGTEAIHLAFGGMHYRIEGLTPGQCKPVSRRFELVARARPPSGPYITIRAAQLDFEEPDVMRYADPRCGYSPIISEIEDGLWIEGLGFRGEINLQPTMRGVLYTQSPDELSDPMVFENYLRVFTAYAVLRAGGVLLHSAGVVRDDRAWIFIGRSGAGKSTISRAALATGADILSDDGNLLLPDGKGGFAAGPVPFAGDLGQVPCQDQRAHPVAGIFWLKQASEITVQPMTDAVAYSRLMVCSPTVNVSRSHNEQLSDVLLELLAAVPAFELEFSREDPFDTIYQRIQNAVSVT